jgi:hypothetical protein
MPGSSGHHSELGMSEADRAGVRDALSGGGAWRVISCILRAVLDELLPRTF